MTKQTIKVEGLPEGWNAVAYRVPVNGENFFYDGKICNDKYQRHEYLIVEKIQPRRIVLEETGEERAYPINGYMYGYIDGARFVKYKILREVKETDIPLTKDDSTVRMGVSQGDGGEPKLELSVKEVRNVRSLIKDFENLGWFINPERALLLQKITEFIKDK